MRDVLASLREFCGKVVRRWYAVAVGVVGGVLGLASALYAEAKPKAQPLVPLWVWLPLLMAGFLVAIIWAFHDVRMERDAAIDEVERRFSALRYALRRSALDFQLELQPDGTQNVQVALRLANDSDDYLRYEMEHMVVIIEGRSVEDPQFRNRGVVIPPHGSDPFRYPFIVGVPADWRTGSIEFTVRYGHASGPLRFRKSQTLGLTTRRLVGPPPPNDLYITQDLVSDSGVEDVREDPAAVGVGRRAGLSGGRARAEPEAPEQPSEIAPKRWIDTLS